MSIFPNYHMPRRAGLVIVLVLNGFFYASAILHLADISGLVPIAINLGCVAYYLLKGGRQLGMLVTIGCAAILTSAIVQVFIWGDASFFK